jgi:hypothetical protein
VLAINSSVGDVPSKKNFIAISRLVREKNQQVEKISFRDLAKKKRGMQVKISDHIIYAKSTQTYIPKFIRPTFFSANQYVTVKHGATVLQRSVFIIHESIQICTKSQ